VRLGRMFEIPSRIAGEWGLAGTAESFRGVLTAEEARLSLVLESEKPHALRNLYYRLGVQGGEDLIMTGRGNVGERVTLSRCWPTHPTEEQALSTFHSEMTLFPGRLFLGAVDPATAVFDAVRFRPEGLGDWLALSGFSRADGFPSEPYKVTYSTPAERTIVIERGPSITFSAYLERPLEVAHRSHKLEATESVEVELASESPKTIDQWDGEIACLECFLTIAMARPAQARAECFLSRNGDFPSALPSWGRPTPQLESRRASATDGFLFDDADSVVDLQTALSGWYRSWPRIRLAVHEYM